MTQPTFREVVTSGGWEDSVVSRMGKRYHCVHLAPAFTYFCEQTWWKGRTVVGEGLTKTTFYVICIFQNLSSKNWSPQSQIFTSWLRAQGSVHRRRLVYMILSFLLQWFLPNVTGFGMKAGKKFLSDFSCPGSLLTPRSLRSHPPWCCSSANPTISQLDFLPRLWVGARMVRGAFQPEHTAGDQ